MPKCYLILAAVHFGAIAFTGILWMIVLYWPECILKPKFPFIRSVHLGSLYLAPTFLGLGWAFERLQVPALHQAAFPGGLGLLVFFGTAGYLFPLPPGVELYYYWTRGWPCVLATVGLLCAAAGLLWTALILVLYSLQLPGAL